MRNFILLLIAATSLSISASGQYPWYTQENFKPDFRMEFTSAEHDSDQINIGVL